MTTENYSYEKSNQKKGMRISLGVHIILLLLAILWQLPNDPAKNIDTQFAVTVAFDEKVSNSNPSKSSAGKERPKAENVEKLETKTSPQVKPVEVKVTKPEIKPVPVEAPKPSDPIVSQTRAEESPIVAIEEEIVVDEPEPEVIIEPSPVEIPTQTPSPSKNNAPSLADILATIEDEIVDATSGPPSDVEESTNAEAGGAPSKAESDDGPGKGQAGTGAGNDSGGNDGDSGVGTGGAGLGEYDDSGRGIFGRRVIYRDNKGMIANASSKTGVIVFKVCVDRKGSVSYVELDELKSTIKDKKIIRGAMSSAWNYRYEPDISAPKEECGKLTVNIENWQGIK